MNTRFPRLSAAASFASALALVAVSSSASAQQTLLEFEILFEINGDDPGDLLGASVDGVGDVDGDGFDDIIVGVQRDDPGGLPNAGTARVYSGATGALIYTFTGAAANGFFGNEVRGTGDVDLDGTPDMIVGGVFEDRNGVFQAGSATVYSGATGAVIHQWIGTVAEAWMGRGVDGAGDVNGDGHADLLVGLTDDPSGLSSGSLRVYSGADGSLIYDIPGAAAGDAFGINVAGLGDLNGDGFDDFAAGARNADTNGSDAGRVTVFSGANGAPMYVYDGEGPDAILHIVNDAGDVNADGTPDFLIGSPGADKSFLYSGADGSLLRAFQGNSSGDGFGSRLANAGDVNADGIPDQLIAAPADDRNGNNAGSTTMYSGADGSVLFTFDGNPGDQLGSGVAGLGDVNGDLCDDFIVGAFFDDSTFNNAGSAKVFVFSGAVCNPDQAAPQVTITNPAQGQVFGATSATFFATVLDDSPTSVTSTPAGIVDSLPAGGGVVSGTLPLLLEGDNQVVISAVDDAGNTGGTTVTVLRDTIDPAITILSPAPNAVFGASPINLMVQIADATATNINFGPNNLALARGGGTVDGDVNLVEGVNTLTVIAVDEAGNQSQVSIDVVLDLSAPLVTIDDPLDGACFGPGDETIPVTATVDDLTATTITTNTTGMAAGLPAGGGVLTGTLNLVEGFNAIQVSATDEVTITGSGMATVLLDTTAPNVDLVSLDPLVPLRGTIDLTATATDVAPGSGVVRVDFEVDGNPIASVASAPYELDFDSLTVPDGTHTFTAIAVDAKGNENAADVAVLIDNTAPAVTFQAPGDGQFVTGTIPLDILASDAGAGVLDIEVTAAGQAPTDDPSVEFTDGQPSAGVSGSQDTTILADGALQLQATVRDAAGNETTTVVSVIVDNTAPEKFITFPLDGQCFIGTMPITIDGSDANLDRLDLFVDGSLVATSTSAPFSFEFDSTGRLDGDMDIVAVAHDLAGNTSNCAISVIVDNIGLAYNPNVLYLSSNRNYFYAVIRGVNPQQIIPTDNRTIELRVPGGSPVFADTAWAGDDVAYPVNGGETFRMNLRFSHQELSNSIQAGIAAGTIRPTQKIVGVSLFIDGLKQHRVRLTIAR